MPHTHTELEVSNVQNHSVVKYASKLLEITALDLKNMAIEDLKILLVSSAHVFVLLQEEIYLRMRKN